MSACAIVVAKCLADSKTRLADALSQSERAALAERMLINVLRAVHDSGEFSYVILGTNGDDTENAATSRFSDIVVVRDGTEAAELAAVTDRALQSAVASGAARALVLMSDLPQLTADEISELLIHPAAIAPDHHGQRTNALLIPLPAPFNTSFGAPDSFSRHRADLLHAGLTDVIVRTPGLAYDVDEPDDLAALGPPINSNPSRVSLRRERKTRRGRIPRVRNR